MKLKKKSDDLKISARNTKQIEDGMKRFRKLEKLTQSDLAKKSGLTQTTISKIEVGLIEPTLPTLFKILTALDLELVLQKRSKISFIPEE